MGVPVLEIASNAGKAVVGPPFCPAVSGHDRLPVALLVWFCWWAGPAHPAARAQNRHRGHRRHPGQRLQREDYCSAVGAQLLFDLVKHIDHERESSDRAKQRPEASTAGSLQNRHAK